MKRQTKIVLWTVGVAAAAFASYKAYKYYKDMYETERKNAEISYYQAIFERDTYARMYYRSIGNEEMAKTFE